MQGNARINGRLRLAWALGLMTAAAACGPDLDGTVTEEARVAASNGTRYQIYWFVPEQPAAQCVYVLDGDQNFEKVAGLVSERARNGAIVPTAVVGIGYADDSERTRDMTPTTSPEVEESGGAAAFFQFLTAELVPAADERLGLADEPARRALVGHSLSGLATAWALLEHDATFYGFVAASPALMWDAQSIFGIEQARAGSGRPVEAALFMGIGGREGFGYRTVFEAFAARLAGRGYAGLGLETHVVRGGQHNGSETENFERGLDFVLARMEEARR